MNLETKVIIDGKEFKLWEFIRMLDLARLLTLSSSGLYFLLLFQETLKNMPKK